MTPTVPPNLSPGDAVEMTPLGIERNGAASLSRPLTGVFLGYSDGGHLLRVRRDGEGGIGSYLPESWRKIEGGKMSATQAKSEAASRFFDEWWHRHGSLLVDHRKIEMQTAWNAALDAATASLADLLVYGDPEWKLDSETVVKSARWLERLKVTA